MIAQQVVNKVIVKLPKELRKKVSGLPVVFEEKPNKVLIEEGIEVDTLGLFVGPAFAEGLFATDSLPSQIIIFVMNIYDDADEEISEFRKQVRLTYLHELGHYLGLDEKGLTDRDLD